LYVKIPSERVGVLVGPGGRVKKMLEEQTASELEIDSETGAVSVTSTEDNLQAMRLMEVVRAIGRGFSPDRAIPLLDDDTLMLDVIDLSKVSNTKSDLARLKGRIIGKDGRTREVTEKLTKSSISVYGKTVALIGRPERIMIARAAIEMLIDGAPHGSVYSYLEKKHQDLIRAELRDM